MYLDDAEFKRLVGCPEGELARVLVNARVKAITCPGSKFFYARAGGNHHGLHWLVGGERERPGSRRRRLTCCRIRSTGPRAPAAEVPRNGDSVWRSEQSRAAFISCVPNGRRTNDGSGRIIIPTTGSLPCSKGNLVGRLGPEHRSRQHFPHDQGQLCAAFWPVVHYDDVKTARSFWKWWVEGPETSIPAEQKVHSCRCSSGSCGLSRRDRSCRPSFTVGVLYRDSKTTPTTMEGMARRTGYFRNRRPAARRFRRLEQAPAEPDSLVQAIQAAFDHRRRHAFFEQQTSDMRAGRLTDAGAV